MTTAPEPDLIWIEDAAREVGRHPATLWRWARVGFLRTYRRRLDRRTYVDRRELETLLEHPPITAR